MLYRIMRKTIGLFDKYNHGKVIHIDFTYQDHIVIWIEYRTCCKAYLWAGNN